MCSTRQGDGGCRIGAEDDGLWSERPLAAARYGRGARRGPGRRTMPIMARRPFLISERRFSASCWELSFLVKPGVSQTAGTESTRQSESMRMRHTTCGALVAPQRHGCISGIRLGARLASGPRLRRGRGEGGRRRGCTVLEELEVARLATLGVVTGRVQALRGVLQAGDREDDLVRVRVRVRVRVV